MCIRDSDNIDKIQEIKPSFFEITAAMAFDYFHKSEVDVAVIEVGLGGRLDSTNVITPLLSVITNISFDHVDMLGDTLEKIAGEKAGIIKKNIPVIIGEKQKDIKHVFETKAKKEAVSYTHLRCDCIVWAAKTSSTPTPHSSTTAIECNGICITGHSIRPSTCLLYTSF